MLVRIIKFTVLKNVNCQSSNLIYVITCNTYGIQYVGQTKNHLLTCFQVHFNDIFEDRNTTVVRQLNRIYNPLTDTSETNIAKFDITINY